MLRCALLRVALLAVAAPGLSACDAARFPTQVRFSPVPATSGFRFHHEMPGGRMDSLPKAAMGGLAVLDYDGDGLTDIYCVNGGWDDDLARAKRPDTLAPNRLFRNLGGMQFEDVTRTAGVGDTGFGIGATVGDVDNDGRLDLFVCNFGRSVLYRNQGDGTFADWTDRLGIRPGWHAGAAFLDYDRDGLLDLFVCQYVDPAATNPPSLAATSDFVLPPMAYEAQPAILYRNQGDGTFADVTLAAGIGKPGRGMGALATDLDGDGWIDLYVANDGMVNFAWRNKGDGTFVEVGETRSLASGRDGDPRASMGVCAADLNGDGRLDYLVPDTMGGAIYAGRDTWFTDRAAEWGFAAHVSRLVGWVDLPIDADNDGRVDVYKTHGDLNQLAAQESQLFMNRGAGRFEPMRGPGSPQVDACSRGAVAADFDDDGRVDLLVLALNRRAQLLRNTSKYPGNWVRLKLTGTTSNRIALGARVTAKAGERLLVGEVSGATGYVSGQDPRLHFGLGAADALTEIEIRWPSGRTQTIPSLEAGREHVITEE